MNKDWRTNLKEEIFKHSILYFFLAIILSIALFVRVYRLDQLLGFYYDQGRDASVIWRFWHDGDLFLIGPTTGIEGIFRGPWYYWLIAPFYLLGGGDPVWPAVFLGLTSVAAIAILYHLAVKIAGRWAGFLAVIITSFSYFLALASRWLSNPTPMLLISMLLVLGMFLVLEGRRWAWILISFMLGMAMQFGSAAEVFYFPAVLVFGLWQRKNLPGKKVFLLSLFTLFISFAPQIVFDIRNNGVLRTAIGRFLVEDQSFRASFWEILKSRAQLYWQVAWYKIYPVSADPWIPTALMVFLSALLNFKNLIKNRYFLTVFILFLSPLAGMLFFQGNKGNVYDYYFTGYYLIFVLVLSVLLVMLAQKTRGFVIVAVFLFLFLQQNLPLLRNYLVAGADGPTHVSLGNELQAVDWVFHDSKGKEFNADVYVPPVIPHAYDYLFLWQATKRCGKDLCGMVLDRQTPLLYTLYEVDPPHPERLDAWLERQKGIGEVEETVRFGGITAERRHRIEQETTKWQ